MYYIYIYTHTYIYMHIFRLEYMVLVVKNLPANARDMRRRFYPWVGKIPWRRGMATHSSIFAQRILPLSMGSQRVRHD